MSASNQRWLFGPGPDLWIGCGGAYAIVFALLCLAPGALQSAVPIGLLPLVTLVTGVPHYGATLLRVYERKEHRDAYRFFTVWATLAVYAWFVLGVYDVAIGSWLVTLYFTWSPWHYTGQNYGLAVMFLRRRGVDLQPETKRWLYASFVLSYALAFLGLHAAVAGSAYAPGIGTSSFRLLRVGIPPSVYAPLAWLVGAGVVGTAARALFTLRRSASWSQLGPVVALVGLQTSWFTLPVVAHATGLASGGILAAGVEPYGLLWIAVAHSVQYLWVTTYYAMSADRSERRRRYLLKTFLAGGAIWGVPAMLFAPGLLGVHAFDTGLALLAGAAVNVHHFILDGAIWKLRDGRVARILIRTPEPAAVSPDPIRPRVWGGSLVRAAVAVAGVAYAVTTVVWVFELEFGVRRASNPPDYERIRTAAERLRWIGRDNPGVRLGLGQLAMQRGDFGTARRELQRSLELQETAPSWVALGRLAEREQRWREALDAFESARAIDPEEVTALSGSGRVLLRLGDAARARAAFELAEALAPDHAEVRASLRQLRGG